MSRILVIGDVHQKVAQFKKALELSKDVDLVIQTGDLFDDFDDNIYEVQYMADAMLEYIDNPKHILLMGNHDFQYMMHGKVICSGYASWKQEVIDKIVPTAAWDKVKYFHSIGRYWFSHAGITEYWFANPVTGLTVESVNSTIEKAKVGIASFNPAQFECLWGADRFRGGRNSKGGLLWNDWRNSEYIDNVTQIVGHTPQNTISVSRKDNSININIDTHMNQVLVLDTEKDSWEIIDI